MNIDVIRKAIKEKGHSWEAEENHITKMDPEARIRMLGVIEEPEPEGLLINKRSVVDLAALPSQIDWRNNNGNFVTNVKDQGSCGSCVGFSSCAVFESMVGIEHGVEKLNNLSVADSFFCSTHGTTCEGWWPASFFNDNLSRGVIPDLLFSYDAAFPTWACPYCEILPHRSNYTYAYGSINSANTVDTTKAYLVNTGPIVACFNVYQDFYGYKSGIYKHTTGNLDGSHAICIVGFNDNNGNGYWICKNSWGPNWGMQGYFFIAYNQCNIDLNMKYGISGTSLPATLPPNKLYTTTQGSDGIWKFDLLTQAKPVQIPSTAGLGFRSTIAINNTMYMTTHGSDGIWKFNMITEATPTKIPSTAGLGFWGIIQNGNTLYLTTQGSDGIWKFDMTTESTPTKIPSTAGLGFRSAVVVNNTIYLTTHGSDGIWKFDMATEAIPTQISSTAGLGFWGIKQVGNILYLTTQGSDGVWKFNLNTEARPLQVPSSKGLGFRELTAFQNIFYLTTHGSDGIWIFRAKSDCNAEKPIQIMSTTGLGFWGIISSGQ